MTALYFIKVRSFFIVFSSDSFYQDDKNKKAYHSIHLSNRTYYQLFDNFSYHAGTYSTATFTDSET